MKPPGRAKAFTSGEATTEKCQSRSARLVRDAIDIPSAVTKRSIVVSRMSGISESICAASLTPIWRSVSGETEQPAAIDNETSTANTATELALFDRGMTVSNIMRLPPIGERSSCPELFTSRHQNLKIQRAILGGG